MGVMGGGYTECVRLERPPPSRRRTLVPKTGEYSGHYNPAPTPYPRAAARPRQHCSGDQARHKRPSQAGASSARPRVSDRAANLQP